MGALVVSYIIGTFVGIPFLALHALRTRRELNGLRDELRARGVLAPAPEGAAFAAGAHDAERPALRAAVDTPALEVGRLAEQQPVPGGGGEEGAARADAVRPPRDRRDA